MQRPEQNETAPSTHIKQPTPHPDSISNPSVNRSPLGKNLAKHVREVPATGSENDAALGQSRKLLRTSNAHTPEVAAPSNAPAWFVNTLCMF